MLTNTVRPLRRTLGSPLDIAGAVVRVKSPEFDGPAVELRLDVLHGLNAANGADYRDMLPVSILAQPGTVAFTPVAGSSLLSPPNLPFDASAASFVSVRARLPNADLSLSRTLGLEIEISLPAPVLVGGICYTGHPHLPGYLTPDGESSSNFGLPREIRVSWGDGAAGFIDSENVVANEEPVSHSGVHYLPIGRTLVQNIRIAFSDFPRMISTIAHHPQPGVGQPGLTVTEFAGLVIPFLYVLEYSESSLYEPVIPTGLLAAVKLQASGAATPGQYGRGFASFDYLMSVPARRFAQLGPASVFGQPRSYMEPPATVPLRECYCSPVLAPGERIVFYLEQSCENVRCAAGLVLTFRALSLPGITARPALSAKVYEIDPPEGVAPTDPASLEINKYATGIWEGVIPQASTTATCRFVRAGQPRFLAVSLANSSSGPGQFAIDSMELLQSAQVAIAPRASRTQAVKTLHYRLIGPALADDHSILGVGNFSLSVERVVGGERKQVLFSASSLLEALESGAQLFANHRYPETVLEESEEQASTLSGVDDRTSKTCSTGWHRSETGEGVQWRFPGGNTCGIDPNSGYGFKSFGNQEIRSQNELIGHEGLGVPIDRIRDVVNTVAGNPDFLMDPTQGPQLLRQDDPAGVAWHQDVWKGMTGIERVGLVANMTVPPWLAFADDAVAGLKQGVGDFVNWIKQPGAVPSGPPIDGLLESIDSLTPLGVLNGLSFGFGAGFSLYVGGNMSFSAAQLLPNLSYSSSRGVTGSINKQANNTGYSYSQHLDKAFDATNVVTETNSSEIHRKLRHTVLARQTERRVNPDYYWKGQAVDILTGAVSIGMTLDATAGQRYRTTDEALVVRIGAAPGSDLEFDIWFDVEETLVRDDY